MMGQPALARGVMARRSRLSPRAALCKVAWVVRSASKPCGATDCPKQVLGNQKVTIRMVWGKGGWLRDETLPSKQARLGTG